jgi:N-acetylmuramoyl-L-alanine amidase
LQSVRGLDVTGVCDLPTWTALVEASWRLGDRLLVLSAPNLRGDDVGELQTILGRLGFDTGRVDGILGPDTVGAVAEFQRNCGLFADGVCGPDTVRALITLARQTGDGPGIAALKELESLALVDRAIAHHRLVIGQFGGMSSLARQITHGLRLRGAIVTPTDEPDASAQAAAANRFGATVYLGFEARAESRCTLAYYAVPSFESVGGRSLAARIERAFGSLDLDLELETVGMRHAALRETRMPAVLCSLGPVQRILDAAPDLSVAIIDALADWAASPLPSSP